MNVSFWRGFWKSNFHIAYLFFTGVSSGQTFTLVQLVKRLFVLQGLQQLTDNLQINPYTMENQKKVVLIIIFLVDLIKSVYVSIRVGIELEASHIVIGTLRYRKMKLINTACNFIIILIKTLMPVNIYRLVCHEEFY